MRRTWLLRDPETSSEVRLTVVARGRATRRRIRVSCHARRPLESAVEVRLALIGLEPRQLSSRTRIGGSSALFDVSGTFDAGRTRDPSVIDVRFVRVASARDEIRSLEIDGRPVVVGARSRRVSIATPLGGGIPQGA